MAEQEGGGWFERVASFATELFGGMMDGGDEGGGMSLRMGSQQGMSSGQSQSGVSMPQAGPVNMPSASPVSASSASPGMRTMAPAPLPAPQASMSMPTPQMAQPGMAPSVPSPSVQPPGGGMQFTPEQMAALQQQMANDPSKPMELDPYTQEILAQLDKTLTPFVG